MQSDLSAHDTITIAAMLQGRDCLVRLPVLAGHQPRKFRRPAFEC
jgi:hypothetical protein